MIFICSKSSDRKNIIWQIFFIFIGNIGIFFYWIRIQVIPDPYYFLYYAGDEEYTRIVEYKKLTGYKSKDTLLVLEIPSYSNKLYPYPIKKYTDIADKYKKDLPDNVFSIGRLGTYKYQSMDMIVKDCLKLKEQIC